FPAQRQRACELLPRHKREGEVDQRKLVEARVQEQAQGVRIEVPRSDRDADVVALDVQMNDVKLVNFLQREQAVMRESPPVRAVLEDVPLSSSLTRYRQDRRPLIYRRAGVIGLDVLRAAQGAAIELHHLGHAADAVPDQSREDPPFALCPLPEVALEGIEE